MKQEILARDIAAVLARSHGEPAMLLEAVRRSLQYAGSLPCIDPELKTVIGNTRQQFEAYLRHSSQHVTKDHGEAFRVPRRGAIKAKLSELKLIDNLPLALQVYYVIEEAVKEEHASTNEEFFRQITKRFKKRYGIRLGTTRCRTYYRHVRNVMQQIEAEKQEAAASQVSPKT